MALWIEDYVIKNKYSRCGEKLTAVKGIVVHWTANAGASDTGHQAFFDGADGGGGRYASAHLFVDRDSATLIVPLNEVAFHANDHACRVSQLKPNANYTSIGVEMCVEKDGTIHAETIERTANIVTELCKRYDLNQNDIFRHYDVTGKNCPAPWVADASKFTAFKNTVANKLKPVATPVSTPAPKPSTNLYRVRKTWADAGSQIGAFGMLDSAIALAKSNAGYEVYDGSGKQVYPVATPVAPKLTPKPAQPVSNKLVYARVLKEGTSGADVKALQTALNKLHFNCGTLDGSYGAKTKDAVRRFQMVYLAHEVDGIAGKKTIDKINSLL